MASDLQNKTKCIMVEKDLRPAYYDRFHCLAADCKLSCCIGWNIAFNKKDYLSMKRQDASPELAERLSRAVRRVRDDKYGGRMYAEFDMSNGLCPLLQEDGLCALQAEKGPGALPEVCKAFPRSKQYLPSGYLERSLSPACEGVLALLWELPSGIDFVSDPLSKEQWCSATLKGNTPLIQSFADIRELCIDFLQDRRFPLPRRILMMGMALRELADGEKDVPSWLARSRSMADDLASGGFPEEPEQEKLLAFFITNVLQTLRMFEARNPGLEGIREDVLTYCGVSPDSDSRATIRTAPYREARERFDKSFGDKEYFFENLMAALLFHLNIPDPTSAEMLWKSYVNFCNLYAFYRFMAVMSCREGAAGDKEELFRMIIFVSRSLIHNSSRRAALRDELFQHGSATLAHMAILLCG